MQRQLQVSNLCWFFIGELSKHCFVCLKGLTCQLLARPMAQIWGGTVCLNKHWKNSLVNLFKNNHYQWSESKDWFWFGIWTNLDVKTKKTMEEGSKCWFHVYLNLCSTPPTKKHKCFGEVLCQGVSLYPDPQKDQQNMWPSHPVLSYIRHLVLSPQHRTLCVFSESTCWSMKCFDWDLCCK